jgi:hypothetical protein
VKGKFLCGCWPSEKRGYSGETRANPIPGGDPVYTDKRYDSDGFEVCPEHGERMYGWKSSDPHQPHYVSNGQGMPPTFISPDRNRRGWRESEFPDMRDNRDPLQMAREREIEREAEAFASNGYHKE